MINGSDVSIVQRLLEVNLAAASVPFPQHPPPPAQPPPPQAPPQQPQPAAAPDYALHVCLMTGHSSDAVSVAVVGAYPAAVRAVSHKGSLPLHDALVKRNHAALVESMVATYPEALTVRRGTLLPRQLVTADADRSMKAAC